MTLEVVVRKNLGFLDVTEHDAPQSLMVETNSCS